jgi:hypothetical protein
MVRASTARLLARRIPGARLEVVSGASHFFLLREHNVRVARIINGFLDEDRGEDVQPEAALVSR